MNNTSPFKWRHFEAEIILLCVRWYLRYSLSYRDLEEMMLERGLHVDHTTIYRWVQHYAPEIDKRSRPHLKACNDSWRVDETYIKVKKVWMYLYRAVDSEGNTLEFLLSSTRDAEAAKRFFLKALHSPAGSAPGAHPVEGQVEELTAATNLTTSALRVINVDKNAAYPKAMAELKASGVLPEAVELRQVKYLNNLVEQDHRFIIPISVLRDHSKMREGSHRTKTFRVGFQLIESFTHLIHHGIKRRKSEIRELLFA
jgi:IS6 family transposase